MDDPNHSDLFEIDSNAFDWLEMAEEFFKHDGSFEFGEKRNNNVVRSGKRYDEIEREFNQLKELYESCPKHVIEPLMPICRDEYDEKQMAGFYMERFEGELLKDYLLDLTNKEEIKEGLAIVDEVREVIDTLHQKDIVHGDLTNNILYDGETFKIFDPVGEPYTQEAYDQMKECDESTPTRLENSAKAPFHNFI